MGWTVIGQINIEAHDKPFTKDVLKKIKKLAQEHDAYGYQDHKQVVYFELSGNKGVDYEVLDKIKAFLLKKKIEFQIVANEYSECDGGYWFDTKEN